MSFPKVTMSGMAAAWHTLFGRTIPVTSGSSTSFGRCFLSRGTDPSDDESTRRTRTFSDPGAVAGRRVYTVDLVAESYWENR